MERPQREEREESAASQKGTAAGRGALVGRKIYVKSIDSALQKISTSKVYCYAYVGDKPCSNAKGEASNMAAVHGGVKVTFKAHISDGAPSTMDDEYGPIQRKYELNAEGEQVQANRTTPEGVVFVSSPPSLTSEPKREPLPSK